MPTMLNLADKLGDLEGVAGVDITLFEIDNKVENIKITLEGSDIDYQEVAEVIQDSGGSIHSIDKVSTGRQIIDEAETPQDGPAQIAHAFLHREVLRLGAEAATFQRFAQNSPIEAERMGDRIKAGALIPIKLVSKS